MLGYLLARAGVDVIVLEKHADFLRDFRGDTIHPSTLQIMDELGLLDQFLKLPHERAMTLGAFFGDREYAFADFTHLPGRCKFVALMPQWDFLNFLAEHGGKLPTFHLHMRAEATDLIKEDGQVVGVHVKTPDGGIDVRADLTVGCDGRHSTVRARAGLTAFMAGVARSVAKENVTINFMLPGVFATDRLRTYIDTMAKKKGLSADAALAERVSTVPARRVGQPDEFGATCAFLCSAQAGYITGQNILIDGGAFPGAF